MQESWQARAAAKRADLFNRIPVAWRLPETYGARPTDVRSIPGTCGILSAREICITDQDHIAKILERVRTFEWSAEEVTIAFCKRAAIAQQLVSRSLSGYALSDQWNGLIPQTSCLTEVLFDSAMKRARELDKHLLRTGRVIGPLHGLPISLKEQFNIAGVESTMGFVSRIGHVSTESATMVQMLLSLGAVIHCRTNVPQTLLCDETINHIFGRVLNPWNTTLTAGGSSGGEAALLALKGSPLGIGTDLGGSIRKPASFCGLYSLRPTPGRLPYSGASNIFEGAEALESACGPMARSRKSVEAFLKIIVGAKPWEWDAKVVERKWRNDVELAGEKKCFGTMRWDGLVRCHPPIERALDEVAVKLQAAGHEVVTWDPLDHAEAQEIVSRIFDSDGGEDVRQWLGESGEPILPQVFTSQHPAMTIHESWQLNKRRDAYRKLFLKTWLATKTRPGAMTDRPIDGIICPTAPHLAAPHLESPRPAGLISYTTVWSLLGLPCYTFPVGVVDPEKDPMPSPNSYQAVSLMDEKNWRGYSPEVYENAPIVLQLVGPRKFAEDDLMDLSEDIEKALESRRCLR
ncbi:amidase, partial [Phenoliferia sp. Uapishka_3]